MGRKKRNGGSNKHAAKNAQPKFTAEDLLKKVEEYLDTFDYDLALKFCQKAIELAPEDLKVIETSACVYAESGDVEKSKELFLKAVEMNGETGHEKFMYLGQMSGGEEAIKWYLTGIEIMKKELANQGNVAENTSNLLNKGPVTRTDISNAFCAVAEIFMTDCCFQDNAEAECEKYCKEALGNDPKNIEAYIVNANFLLSLERKEEAKNLLKGCFEMLNIKAPQTEESGQQNENNEMENAIGDLTINCNTDEDSGSENLPPYASRVTLAKLLTETGEHDKAEVLLHSLVDDNDEDIEVWYMHGWNCYLQDDFSDAEFYLGKAKELYEKLGCDDEELINHMEEISKKCKSQIGVASSGMEVE